jgi:hypothetical protein
MMLVQAWFRTDMTVGTPPDVQPPEKSFDDDDGDVTTTSKGFTVGITP